MTNLIKVDADLTEREWGNGKLPRDDADRDTLPHTEGLTRAIKWHIDHGWSNVRIDGDQLRFGFDGHVMMVVWVTCYGGDPTEARAWIDARKVADLLARDQDDHPPDPDRACTIGDEYQRDHAPLEVAREVWRRLDLPALEEGADGGR
jgi:hypothetical protein